jgi:hypothetical protein
VAERSGDTAFARTVRHGTKKNLRPYQSGAEVTAFQTLARLPNAPTHAKRLEGGVFTAAFVRTTRYRTSLDFRPRESGVALCFPPQSKTSRN